MTITRAITRAVSLFAAVALGSLTGSGCISPPPPPVVLMTDFGLQDDAVGLMRGVIHSIAPGTPIADLTHSVRRFDVSQGARRLADAPRDYPPGSVFVVVVDPGVGTARRAIVVRLANGTLLVAPDNGVASFATARYGPVEVRAATDTSLFLPTQTSTFHGRDVFAPVGAHLAAGVPFERVGPVIDDWIRLELIDATRDARGLHGVVEDLDLPFGNVWTNIPGAWAAEAGWAVGDVVTVVVAGVRLEVPLAATFGDVPVGAPLLYENSRGNLALALNQADFAATYGVEPDARIDLER